MPRKLPWLQPKDAKIPTRPPPSKRRRVTTSPLSSSDDLPGLSPNSPSHTHCNVQTLRSPSTSPPPAPPKQDFMRPGLDQDDAWIMVEDEFEATARLFTLHLHQAEYKRQKELARKREEALGGADEIARPVVGGGLSTEAQRKKAVEAQKKKIQAAQGKEEDEEEIVDPWMGTQLAGLMTSLRKRDALPARGMAEPRTNTRAAAGFDRKKPVGKTRDMNKEEKEVNESTDDDDLDAPPRAASKPASRVRQPVSTERIVSPPANPRPRVKVTEKTVKVKHTSKRSSSHDKPSSNSNKYTPRPEKPTPNAPPKPTTAIPVTAIPVRKISTTITQPTKPEPEPEDSKPLDFDMGFPSIPSYTCSQGGSVLARRREARIKREKEEKEKAACTDTAHELPTFLF